MIKGISGYADSSASLTEDWIPFASAMAASLVNKMLSEPMVFEQWPHYQSRDANTSQGTNRSGRRGRGGSHVKGAGMLVVSLRSVNFGFWSHLECSG